MSRIAVIGAGAWGTALAITAARAGCTVGLWAREKEVVESIRHERRNALFLPDHTVDDNVVPTGDMGEAAAGAELALLVAPAQHVGAAAEQLAGLPDAPPIVVCAKGIDRASGRLLSEVVADALPGRPVAVLSGPSFAGEVAQGLPAALTAASTDRPLTERVAQRLGAPRFRIYLSDDPVGVEIGGAVKNVIAIACGIVVGAGLGENARAAVVTRGLAETVRLAVARGGRAQTLAGLSGIGDMMLTCNSFQSRNMSLGAALGAEPDRSWTPAEVLAARGKLAEGVWTAAAVIEMAAKLDVEMPICAGVNAVLHRGETVRAMVDSLMARRFREE
ncbi:MAG: NAD(P)-dependent glycerol-3-phosphate dehydrogenase [Rhodospirillaceae bacterium]|nr:NAD(P)-dependent glycerol-3-phosphate dehydrogenase [Rhodospirillaceae bacterium]MYB13686.1 NAD(P)-dependent glycerol-3-phosphate dehydrogenase [Rhodospirillaceae bacterium]MYI48022.1 NAD(P)-dependent glycerol-3-phosphate dehydrogenase [Rhodospirillaceae bacterium]